MFGDGDPNVDLDDRCVRAAARAIRQAGGAVTAEQLAPFIASRDGATAKFTGETSIVDESFVSGARGWTRGGTADVAR